MGFVRRVFARTLVITLSLIGIPLPAHAAGEETPPLTINGLPLSQFLDRTATGDQSERESEQEQRRRREAHRQELAHVHAG